ncbi:MAG: bacteriohemerythrin [Desulfovibrio sp.]
MQSTIFDDSLRTGFDAIDEQHRMFLDMLSELGEQIQAGHHRQGVLDAFQGMRAYADGHFSDEEATMAGYDYPDLAAHCRQHETFRSMTRDLEQRTGEGPGLLSLETLEYLGTWFVGHIRNDDQRFAAFAREHGTQG